MDTVSIPQPEFVNYGLITENHFYYYACSTNPGLDPKAPPNCRASLGRYMIPIFNGRIVVNNTYRWLYRVTPKRNRCLTVPRTIYLGGTSKAESDLEREVFVSSMERFWKDLDIPWTSEVDQAMEIQLPGRS